MMDERLLEFEYYVKKLPLYMQNSYGMVDHFKIIFDLLYNLNTAQNNVSASLDVFNLNYLDFINSLEGNDSGTVSEILDKLGQLFNVSRNFNVSYIDENDEPQTQAVSLNNSLLLSLIKARIIQNCFDGTFETANKFYKSANLPIYMFTDAIDSAVCNVIYNTGESETPSQDLIAIFMSGLLTITSMGIQYVHSMTDLSSLLVWNSSENIWDSGRWA